MYNESQLKVANLIIKNKVFSYDKKIGMLSGFKFYFTAKVTGQRVMYHAGEPYHTIQLDVEVVKVSGPLAFRIFDSRKGINFNRIEMIEDRSHQAGFDYLMRDMARVLEDFFKVLDSNVTTQVENLKISENLETEDPLNFGQISEAKVSRNMTRTIVRDIVDVLKLKQESEFHLPGALRNEDRYSFIGFSDFNVIVDVNFQDENKFGTDYRIEAGFQTTENTLQFIFEINPERLEKNLYSIIGELNDYVAHELQHLRQQDEGRISKEDFIGSNFEYFMQPDEIEAQYYGLKRKAKLMKLPLKDVIDDYFAFKQDLFELTNNEINQIKKAVLSFRPDSLSLKKTA
jgi:hypothetical protein